MQPKRMLLLGILLGGEQSRDRIEDVIANSPSAVWAPNSANWVSVELEAMTATGLVVSPAAEDPPGRARYGITPKGRQALHRSLQQAWEAPPDSLSPQEVAALFSGALGQDEYAATLGRRLGRLRDSLRQLESRAAAHPLQSPLGEWHAVSGHAVERLHSEIAWIESMLNQALITRQSAQPTAESQASAEGTRLLRQDGAGLGAFTFVLHTHLPYCRKAGRWPHGEEWLHEAMAETYVPLLDALYDLRAEGVPFRLTIGLTPILTEQLADADVLKHFELYLDEEIAASASDILRFAEEDSPHLIHLATYYRDLYSHIKTAFLVRFGGDIVGSFGQLQDEGTIEIITSAATHGYLPLLSRDSSIYAQLRAGVQSYKRHFGRAPRAIWLPECAYRPAYLDTSGVTRPALEEFLAAQGITCFFVETHAIEGGRPVGKAAGEVAIGPYAAIRRQYVVPVSEEPISGGSTFSAYHVVGSDRGLTDPPVAAIGRNNRTGQQVWAADWGYPGEADYREFHKKDHESGLQYWRVTGTGADLGGKDLYHPEWAEPKIEQHALHYARLVERLLREHHSEGSGYGIVASNYDTELFGHWWFEGVEWIKQTLRALAASDVADLTTASAYLDAHPPEQALALPESSWGSGGTHWTWDNPGTKWMWGPIHEAERRMEGLVVRHSCPAEPSSPALDQAGRELLLAESSDWPFLVTTGQAKHYAIERFQSHLSRFHQLADLLDAGRISEAEDLARDLYELDKVFPDLDPLWFAERQGKAD